MNFCRVPLCLLLAVLSTLAACADHDADKASLGDDDDDVVPDDDAADDDAIDDSTNRPPGMELEWVDVAGGTFEMGCSPGDDQCDGQELPRHTVTLSPFQITPYEITQEQWDAVKNWNFSAFRDCRDCPITYLGQGDAQEFCEAFGARLPTEAEWEYAARAGSTTRFYCGDDAACLGDVAWYALNAGQTAHPVGLKEPNDFGLYDMLGNAFEWVADWYRFDYYETSPEVDPLGPPGREKVIRGGAYSYTASFLRASYRWGTGGGIGHDEVGFRCARDAD
ncbi:MAG TPA: formylglycine-generating enzyme family protein [bacterium]|nr:formylglycine-generating enzyme family protein [bacterium]